MKTTITVEEDVFTIKQIKNMFYVYRNGCPLEKFYNKIAAINFVISLR